MDNIILIYYIFVYMYIYSIYLPKYQSRTSIQYLLTFNFIVMDTHTHTVLIFIMTFASVEVYKDEKSHTGGEH